VPDLAAPHRDDTILKTCRLIKPDVSRTILLLRRRDRSLSPAASAVWSALLQLYRKSEVSAAFVSGSGATRRGIARRRRRSRIV
jgi:hypothetical protein